MCLSAARQSVARPTIVCALVELYVASATFLSSKMGCFARPPRLAQFGGAYLLHGARQESFWGKTGTPMRVLISPYEGLLIWRAQKSDDHLATAPDHQ